MNRISPSRGRLAVASLVLPLLLWFSGVAGNIPVVVAADGSIDSSRRTAIVRAAELLGPAVVSISITRTRLVRKYRDFFDFFDWHLPQYEEIPMEIPAGSGFIVDSRGLILTNAHVIEEARGVTVTFPDGRSFKGRIAAVDSYFDLALIKIDGKVPVLAKLGDSDRLIIGEWAIAIGNPFGSFIQDPHPSVTVGVISALNRNIRSETGIRSGYRNMIQTDAAINPGNSGGPLANSRGEVIGINTFIFSTSGGSMGMGFAIPINRAKRFIDEVKRYGRVRDVWYGIVVQDISPKMADAWGLEEAKGVLVVDVERGSSADAAGLRRGDIILTVNGKVVRNVDEIRAILLQYRVGDSVRLGVVREGRKLELLYKLKEKER